VLLLPFVRYEAMMANKMPAVLARTTWNQLAIAQARVSTFGEMSRATLARETTSDTI
jgi:hypothetical protein